MGLSGQFRSRSFSRANRPNRLVRQQNTRELRRGQRAPAAFKLALENSLGKIALALAENLTHTNDRRKPFFERSLRLEMHGLVGFVEILPAFGVTDDHCRAAGLDQHPDRKST